MTQMMRSFGDIVVLFIPLALFSAAVIYKFHRHKVPPQTFGWMVSRVAIDTVLFLNISGFLFLTLKPGFPLGRSLNLIPFDEYINYFRYGDHMSTPFIEITGNIIILLPCAVVAGFKWSWADSYIRTIGFTAIMVSSVETLQYTFGMGRVASVTDIFSAMIGAGCGRIIHDVIKSTSAHKKLQHYRQIA